MAFTIASSVGASMAAATGRSTQGHLQYAVNQGAYWIIYPSTTGLIAAYSTNGGSSWTNPSGSPYTVDGGTGSEGRRFGFAYANISSNDVLHGSLYTPSGGSAIYYHNRWTLGTTWGGPTVYHSYAAISDEGDNAACFSSANKIYDIYDHGNSTISYFPNADSGSSWTAGTPTETTIGGTNLSANNRSFFLASIGSGNLLALFDNGSAAATMTNLSYSTGSVSTWTSAYGTTAFGSNLTATSVQNWGAFGRTTSDIHAIALSNNSNNYSHARYNGSSWSSGSAIGSLAYGTNSGISVISDGTSVWAAVIDTSNNIQYNKWTSGGGWGGWTVLEATRTNAPAYITGCYDATNQRIMWCWTEHNGSNYDIIGSTLSTAPPVTGIPFVAEIPYPYIPSAFLAM